MPTLSLSRRILAGLAGAVSLIACSSIESENCDLEFCARLDWEVNFADTLGRGIETLGTAGLFVSFDRVPTTAKASASTNADCASCTAYIVTDSAMLMADRPIISPEGDSVPAGSNLLKQPWKDMLGRGDLHFRFRHGVRFQSGPYAFSVTAPWVSQATGTRVVLSDTSYLPVP